MEIAPVVREALNFWHSPSFTELPIEVITGALNRCVSERVMDIELTPDACFAAVTSATFNFGSSADREYNLSGILDDASRIIRVESRTAGSTELNDWTAENRGSYENWGEVLERGDANFIAFYGHGDNLTMVSARDMSNLELRIVYHVLRDSIETLQGEAELPEAFRTVLTYDLALEFSELIDNRSPEFQAIKRDKVQYLTARREDALKRADKWRRSSRSTSVSTRRSFSDRTPAWGPRRWSITRN